MNIEVCLGNNLKAVQNGKAPPAMYATQNRLKIVTLLLTQRVTPC